MPTTVLNIGHANNSANASFTVAVPNGVPAGATIVVGVRENTTTVALASGNVTDSGGNSYTLATSASNTAGRTGMWFVQNCKAIAAGGTITFTKVGAATDATTMSAGFIEGIGANDAAVTSTTVSNVSATTLTMTSNSPQQAGELFVSFIGIGVSSTSVTNDGAWTSPPLDVAANINPSVAGGFRTNAGAGTLTYVPSWATASTSTAGIIIGFRPVPSGQVIDWSKPARFLPSVALVLPIAIVLQAQKFQLREPVLGGPKKPPVSQVVPLGSPFVLMQPPVVVSQPRAPVLGPVKQPRISVPFLQSTPATLVASLVQNPFIPVDYSVPHDVISAPPQATPYNINIFTNPIPFGPYDYSEGPTSIKFIKPFEPQPNYQNFYPNPVPFGPYDYSEGPFVPKIAKNPPNWSLNINLQRNPIPFGPYDYNKVWPPQPSRPFDQQPNYPNFYTNPIPFGPFDWNKPAQPYPSKAFDQQPNYPNFYPNPIPFSLDDWSKPFPVATPRPIPALPNIALTAVVAPPFFNPDFSKPFFVQVRIDQTQPSNINIFTNPIPFIPVDYNIQHDVIGSPPQALPYNINIFTNPIPFGPYDYQIGHDVVASPPQAVPYNINIFTNPIPFGPFDYNTTHDVVSSPPQAAPYNINIFVNPIPSGPFDWSRGAQFLPRTPPAPIERNPLIFSEVPLSFFDWSRPAVPRIAPQLASPPYTISLLTPLAVPFIPVDFSKPYFPQVRIDQTQPTNVNLFTNPIPFGPFDWSKPFAVASLPPQPQPYNLVIGTVVVAPPFFNPDFSRPYFLKPLPGFVQIAYGNFYPNPLPFGPYDYNKQAQPLPSRPFEPQPNYDDFYPNPLPFGPYDWNKVQQPPPAREPPRWALNINLNTNPIPFGPYDYNRAQTARLASPPQAQPYNPNIFTNAIPFALYDWSRPFAVVSLPPQALPPSIALTTVTVTVPFAQVDWSARPYFPRNQFDATRSLDLELYTNPIPFAQHDWSARPGQFPPRAPDQIYPNLPLRPTVVTVTIIQRTLTGVGL